MRYTVATAFAALGLLVALPLIGGTREAASNDLSRAAQHIVTPDGIQVQKFIRIGGIEQWISIRGRHRDNPILLFLHGGPGFTSIPTSYYYMRGWEEYFTVVQWDQRGAGKTYLANDPAKVRQTMTIDRMTADAEELIECLRKTYDQKRIVLMAHSWGTILGIKLVQRHPDWFYAYVGMGQFVDFARSELLGYRATLAAARADHNQKAVADLKAIAPYPDLHHLQRSLHNLGRERRWLEDYDGDAGQSHDELGRFSPGYSSRDLQARRDGLNFSLDALWSQLSGVDFTAITRFHCPMIFMQGRRDLTTSATVLADWYKTLHAPYKKLVWFEDSAHLVYEEEPGKVLVTLVNDVLPLTRRQ